MAELPEARIKILDHDTIGKIAAGEVVERPASIVKELIENSIDAGAKKIEVEVKDGGKTSIRVTDDGCGMTKEELDLSLLRHSTSKIRSAADLFAISTLGFRGEALPSIIAVTKFEVVTKTCDTGNFEGSMIRGEGGRISEASAVGCPAGTTIKLSNLFFNTPARKKFLKSTSTEISHISDIVSKYILAYPGVSFKLLHNGDGLFFSDGGGSLINALTNVYGSEMSGNAVSVDHSSGYVDVKGYVLGPTVSRIDRSMQSFFVNGRSVKNFLLSRALEEAYRSLMPRDRHPIAALFITIDPKEIDVNVHPTKREIRFAKTSEVLKAVTAAASEALGVKPEEDAGGDLGFGQNAPSWKAEMTDVFFGDLPSGSAARQADVPEQIEGGVNPFYQLLRTYILSLDGDGFILIDQHAAHERIIYEEVKRRKSGEGNQALLVPENIELTQADAPVLESNIDYLRDVGFDIEEFGRPTYVIRSVPAQLVGKPARSIVQDIVTELKSFGKSMSAEDRKDAIMKLVACHSAVRAGDALTREEMAGLLKRLGSTSNPTTCPHGRPTMVKFSRADLEKVFGRT
jgi:DNA mismatch repair protein MutL